MAKRLPVGVLPATSPKPPWLKRPPEVWGSPGMGLTELLPVPQNHGLAVVLFFQLHQHSRETGGGPGVKGTFPKHGSGWRWGCPQLCMAWHGQLRPAGCMATAGSAQHCFAWLESQCMSLVGRGVGMVLCTGLCEQLSMILSSEGTVRTW